MLDLEFLLDRQEFVTECLPVNTFEIEVLNMVISEELLARVAELSRIRLNEEEKKKFLKQLNDILDAFRKIEEVDVENVAPSFQPIELKNSMRKDMPKKFEWNPLSNVTEENKEDGYIKSPRVIGEP